MDSTLLTSLKSDCRANANNTKGKLIVLSYRLANCLHRGSKRSLLLKILSLLPLALYKLTIDYVMGIHIPPGLEVGDGLRVYHGQGLVIHEGTIIGRGVTLRHGTTIGSRHIGPAQHEGPCPVLEDNVELGAQCILLGGITIGKNTVIGAGSVVTKSIPPNVVAVGNPARIVKSLVVAETSTLE